MTIRCDYANMSGPTSIEQLPSLRALHIHPTQTPLSEASLYNSGVTSGSKLSAPGPPPPSEASQSFSDDSDTFSAPMTMGSTPLSSPSMSTEEKHDSGRARKRRSSSSSGSIDSQYYEERGKLRCHRISETIKSEKKAAKERAHRDGESFYRRMQEDALVNYVAFWPSNQLAKGNKFASGLTFPKAITQRAWFLMSVRLVDDSFRLALQEGRVDEWRAQWQEAMEDHIGDDDRLLEGTLLDIPNEKRCCHANSKQQGCSTHGHKDWIECRRGRYRAAFQDNLREYERQMMASGRHGTTKV